MKKILLISLLLLFSSVSIGAGVNSSFTGSRFDGLTREATIAEYVSDVDSGNNLIDKSGSNILTYSEDFSDAAWTKTNVSVTADQVNGPLNISANADLLEPSAADSHVYQDSTGSVGTTYTCSFYLRSVTGTISLSIHAYDQAHGTILGTEAILINEQWKKYSVSGKLVTGDTDIGCTIGGNTTWSTDEDIYAVRAQASENNEWNRGAGVYHEVTTTVTKPLHDLADSGTPTPTLGDLQKTGGVKVNSISYDGTGDYFSKAHHDSMNIFDADHTLTFVFKRDKATEDTLFSHYTAGVGGIRVNIADADDKVDVTYEAAGTAVAESSGAVTDGTLAILQIVRSDNTATVYVNNVAGTGVDVTGFGVDTAATFSLGSRVGTNDFSGQILYARFDTEALTTDELKQESDTILGILGNTSGASWTFDRDSEACIEFSTGRILANNSRIACRDDDLVRIGGPGGGVFIEGTATNLQTYSQNMDTATTDWAVNSYLSITTEAAAAPDGKTTANILHENADDNANTTHFTQSGNVSFTNGQDYVLSFFAAPINRDWIRTHVPFSAGSRWSHYDVANGVIGTESAGVTSEMIPYPDGWYKVNMFFTANATETILISYYVAEADADITFIGLDQDSLYVWQFQIEEWFPTSVTVTTAAAASNSGDDLTLDPHEADTTNNVLLEEFSATIPYNRLTIQFETKCLWESSSDIGEDRALLEISGDGGTASDTRNRVYIYGGSDGRIYATLSDDADADYESKSAVDTTAYNEWFTLKFFLDFSDLSRMNLWINGDSSGTTFTNNTGTADFDTSGTLIRIGQEYDGTINSFCYFRNLKIQPYEF
jgi:hypothetical protein